MLVDMNFEDAKKLTLLRASLEDERLESKLTKKEIDKYFDLLEKYTYIVCKSDIRKIKDLVINDCILKPQIEDIIREIERYNSGSYKENFVAKNS